MTHRPPVSIFEVFAAHCALWVVVCLFLPQTFVYMTMDTYSEALVVAAAGVLSALPSLLNIIAMAFFSPGERILIHLAWARRVALAVMTPSWMMLAYCLTVYVGAVRAFTGVLVLLSVFCGVSWVRWNVTERRQKEYSSEPPRAGVSGRIG